MREKHAYVRELVSFPCAALLGIFLMIAGVAAGCAAPAAEYSLVSAWQPMLQADALTLIRLALLDTVLLCGIYSALLSPFMAPVSALSMFVCSCAQGMTISALLCGGFTRVLAGILYLLVPFTVQSSAQLTGFVCAVHKRQRHSELSSEDATKLRRNAMLWAAGIAAKLMYFLFYARAV